MNPEKIGPPSPRLHLALTELPRLSADIAALYLGAPLLRDLPAGDGHGVLVLPGFLGSDDYNQSLISFLNRQGYAATGWGLGQNRGPSQETEEGMIIALSNLLDKTGGKVSLIGHSLGGVYARELARGAPEHIRQVISLGSPINDPGSAKTPSAVLYRRMNPDEQLDTERRAQLASAPPVPTTAVYTKGDGVVPWRRSRQYDGHAKTENIRVYGSHMGMTLNTAVWMLLADRLTRSEHNWTPFTPRREWQPLFPR